MTDLELNKIVAEALGCQVWLDYVDSENEAGPLMKTPSGDYLPLPNWAEDLSACMAKDGPLEWLFNQGVLPKVGFIGDRRAYCEYGSIGVLAEYVPIKDDPLKACALAICNAVLAVAARLKGAR